MMPYVSLYYFFAKPTMTFIRLLILCLLLGWLMWNVAIGESIKLPFIFFSLVSMWEIFFHFKLAHLYPTKKLSDIQSVSDTSNSTTMPALAAFSAATPQHFVTFLIHQTDIQFMLSRMLTLPKEIQAVQIDHQALLQKAKEYALTTHTTYIDTPHIFAAYLILSEPQTKLLFQKQLKEQDVLRLIVWTQLAYPTRQDQPRHFQVIGEGYGETLTTGWTLETQKYTTDWTAEALLHEPKMFGDIDIFSQMIGILSQPTHNNVLLIGEPGCGKHLVIDKLAFESYNGLVPKNLQHKRVLALVTGALLAGMENQQELATRLQVLLAELAHAQVIIAIPEIQDILGSSSFHTDLSATLLPYLEQGTIPIIATITPENYKRYMEHSSLNDVFTSITFTKPDTETLFGMLFMAVLSLEQKQQLHFSYLSVVKAAELASRFSHEGVLPGTAVKLLESTGTSLLTQGKTTVTAQDIEEHIEKTTHVQVGKPDEQETNMLMHLEEVLHQNVIGQENAIVAISQGMRRMRANLSSTTKPISFLFLGPTGVGKTETAKTLADVYYHGQANMIRLDMSEYSGPDGIRRLLGSAPGEGDEKGELTEKIYDHPSSLILLDEFEKANPAILDLFLQILDDGRLTDNKGKTVSFQNCIIIATSNAGSEFIREHIAQNQAVDKTFHQALLNQLQTNHLFKPELLNRFDEVVIFTPLDHQQVLTITTMLLKSLVNKLKEEDITLSFDQAVIEKIANESFDPQLGARPIQRYMQTNLEDILAQKKLNGTLQRGTTAIVVLDQAGQIDVQVA
jgi:ATP-dependent Clp protease ATP-binding subunit ClpC